MSLRHNCAWQLTYRFDAVTHGAGESVQEVHRSAAGKGAACSPPCNVPASLLTCLGPSAVLQGASSGTSALRSVSSGAVA